MSFSWSMKSTPVAYSVKQPTSRPNITQRPFPISFASVQPNTLWRCRGQGNSSKVKPINSVCKLRQPMPKARQVLRSVLGGLRDLQALEVFGHFFCLRTLVLDCDHGVSRPRFGLGGYSFGLLGGSRWSCRLRKLCTNCEWPPRQSRLQTAPKISEMGWGQIIWRGRLVKDSVPGWFGPQ